MRKRSNKTTEDSIGGGWSQQPVGANHIKQGADNLLAMARRLARATIGRLEVLDDCRTITDNITRRCNQGRNGRQFSLGQNVGLETLVTGG